ncbi:DUF6932 family protein [Treponema putidum]|uniref:DUF6932 family protein n=1 Tax=Treponema putidum TaxID=221027 RepID=UPI003D8A8FC7
MVVKKEYEPILPAGLHTMNLEKCKELCVNSFCGGQQRLFLYGNLCKYIGSLSKISVHFEIWIDGSFTTKKPEPNDIDIVIFAEENDISKLSGQKQGLLYDLINKPEVRKSYSIDIYFAVKNDLDIRSYWRGWFGFTRDEKPKGIIVLEV